MTSGERLDISEAATKYSDEFQVRDRSVASVGCYSNTEIVVYLSGEVTTMTRPSQWMGYPVRYVVTGKIKPLGASDGD